MLPPFQRRRNHIQHLLVFHHFQLLHRRHHLQCTPSFGLNMQLLLGLSLLCSQDHARGPLGLHSGIALRALSTFLS